MLDHSYLLTIIDYNKEIGIFTWKRTYKRAKIGDSAGSRNVDGYHRIMIDRIRYPAHRLAWFYVFGVWPSKLIDHINGIKDDNRITNLRLADYSQNRINTKINCNNPTGVRGVLWSKDMKKWKVHLTKNKRYFHLGYFDNFETACAARRAQEAKIFGAFVRVEK